MPSITVNGQSTTTLSIGLAGGTTEAVTIESSGDWTMTVTGENGADASACTPSLSSGSKGTKTVTFDLTEAATPRTYTVKVTTSGTIPGIGVATLGTDGKVTAVSGDRPITVLRRNLSDHLQIGTNVTVEEPAK